MEKDNCMEKDKVEQESLKYDCKKFVKYYELRLDKKFKKKFQNTYILQCRPKFVLPLRKGFYSY